MLPPSCLQDGSRSQLGPPLAPIGSILAPKRPPRGPQETPKRPQEAPYSPLKLSVLCGRGSIFLTYQVACNMSPLGSRRGPALRDESGHPSVGRVKTPSSPKTCLSTDDFVSPGAPRVPLGRAESRGVRGLLAPKTVPLTAQVRPSCLQDGPKRGQDGKMMAR